LLTGPTSAPALVLAAVVHAELAVLRPFGSADGVIARAAERLTLVEYGLDPKSLAVVEVGHLELGDAYPQGLRAYLSGTPDGVAAWVRHCADAVVLGVRETTAICEAMQRG
ncbi:oxidoreductase, partial [Streptosporangium algeriense]